MKPTSIPSSSSSSSISSFPGPATRPSVRPSLAFPKSDARKVRPHTHLTSYIPKSHRFDTVCSYEDTDEPFSHERYPKSRSVDPRDARARYAGGRYANERSERTRERFFSVCTYVSPRVVGGSALNERVSDHRIKARRRKRNAFYSLRGRTDARARRSARRTHGRTGRVV